MPEPDGPMMATTSPLSSEKSIASSAVNAPNCLVAVWIWSSGLPDPVAFLAMLEASMTRLPFQNGVQEDFVRTWRDW